MFGFITRQARYFVVYFIEIYQKTFSPDHSFWAKKAFPYGYCRFHPTCSNYAKEAILKYGMIKGGQMAAWRILRCNPWSKGGEDLVG